MMEGDILASTDEGAHPSKGVGGHFLLNRSLLFLVLTSRPILVPPDILKFLTSERQPLASLPHPAPLFRRRRDLRGRERVGTLAGQAQSGGNLGTRRSKRSHADQKHCKGEEASQRT